jgi:hypothetical protein
MDTCTEIWFWPCPATLREETILCPYEKFQPNSKRCVPRFLHYKYFSYCDEPWHIVFDKETCLRERKQREEEEEEKRDRMQNNNEIDEDDE